MATFLYVVSKRTFDNSIGYFDESIPNKAIPLDYDDLSDELDEDEEYFRMEEIGFYDDDDEEDKYRDPPACPNQ